jgi:hypothetical protein
MANRKFFTASLPAIVVFILINDGSILQPSNSDWLNGDAFLAWQGWQFFRNSPLLQWPIGANPDFGLELSTSIVFPDSIPLLAILAKPFSPLLYSNFQYYGLWIFTCFYLQSYFAVKIISLFSEKVLSNLLAATFFLISPILLIRLGYAYQHHALFSQWTILAALYFFFRKEYNLTSWTLLLVTTVLINAYLFLIVLCIFIATLISRVQIYQLKLRTALLSFMWIVSFLGLIMYAAGYFMNGAPIGKDGFYGGGFGSYRMNLLAPLDGNGAWSRFIPDISTTEHEGEGFNFLGIGVILLIPTAVISAYKQLNQLNVKKIYPLIAILFVLTVYAISINIYLGSRHIHSYNLPNFIINLANQFSSSGRFFWPTYYLIYIAIFYFNLTYFNKKLISVIFLCALLIQIADSSHGFNDVRKTLTTKINKSTLSESQEWIEMSRHFRYIRYAPPGYIGLNAALLYDFSSKHKMGINLTWQSKANISLLERLQYQMNIELSKNQLINDSIYVFKDKNQWISYQNSYPSEKKYSAKINDLFIVTPNFLQDKFENSETKD